jgi:chemotaxis protein methyltransferase CheR
MTLLDTALQSASPATARDGAMSFGEYPITDTEFAQFQRLIHQIAGISLSDAKKVLLVGRLGKRLKHFGFRTFSQYYRLIADSNQANELQTAVDLLTTNETYFFREPKHFEFLATTAAGSRDRDTPFRVWSAASSSGEEAYSMAMVLAETLGDRPWDVVGTDISTQVLARAERGQYPLDRATGIPAPMLKRYCLKGTAEQDGTLLVRRELRQRVRFLHSNLLNPVCGIGQFDVIFLRNVMIYFDDPTKRRVVAALMSYLKPDGYFIVGHSETLNGLTSELTPAQPTIYRTSIRL